MTDPEFSRPQRLDQIGAGENRIEIEANAEERTALARRFGLANIAALESKFTLLKDATGVVARGHLSAKVTQSCTVTGDPLPVTVAEDFAIRFHPEPDTELPDETELSEDECDTVFYSS